MNLKEQIEVMQAFERGEGVQGKNCTDRLWRDVPHPKWDWNGCEYRTPPAPPVEVWATINKDQGITVWPTKGKAEVYTHHNHYARVVLLREIVEGEV